ncbi:MAG: cupin domain-containing protein [Bacteroidota bacterium]|nr:cupin domain-containing protein [Bacteroidota bacterium]MDP4231839.1 cupin domain-containing protein [Bacteroidota bacterium]MDP4242725.1 cupin domain-containing protein [Bacteroidota bacterium]MDP4287176.1 cupin domain-containing protein [Bacteroidota bacterium]
MDTPRNPHSLSARNHPIRFATIAVFVSLTFSLVGCSRQTGTSNVADTTNSQTAATPKPAADTTRHIESYLGNIIQNTNANQNFRKVLFTGQKSQLVAMSIPPGGEIGAETHSHVEQTIFIQSGSGTANLGGKVSAIKAGDVLVVTPGTAHNVVNAGKTDLKLYTIYTPPNHIDGRINATKADAERDKEDEAFGEAVGD